MSTRRALDRHRANEVQAQCAAWNPEDEATPYSARRASVGLTEAARCAGTKLAASDAEPNRTATPASVGTSHAATPKSTLRISIEAPTDDARPMARPTIVSHPAWRITSL